MITLSTGLPGAGKTLFTISKVKELSEKEGRPVWYSGIADLSLPWQEIDPERWMDAPDGSIIVIDECQRIFRPRGNGSQVPAYVSGLETHRHKGLDIFLVTQHPMLVDANVRRLTERHYHVARRFGMQRATILEFESCKDQPLAKLAGAQRHEWSYPTAAFSYYKSAQVHTVKRRLPMQLWVLISVIALVIGLSWYFVRSHYQDGQVLLPGQTKPAVPVSPQLQATAPVVTPRTGPAGAAGQAPLTAAQYIESHQPRVAGLQHTAPIYDEVTKPVRAPVPVGAVVYRGKCQAYSQQGTPLDMPPTLCQAIFDRGYFRAFDSAPESSSRTAPPESPAVTGARHAPA